VRNIFLFLSLVSVINISNAQQKNNLRQYIDKPIAAPNDIQTPGGQNSGNVPVKMMPKSMSPDSVSKPSPVSPPADYKPSPDSLIKIGLILPLDAENTVNRLYAAMSDKEGPKIESGNLKESATEALDFYEGLKYALNTDYSKQKIALYIFDTQNSDSTVQELMRDDQLRACDIIIGPTTSNQARIVAAFCKKNKILNIQPFVASKSFATDNPYLVRFMPTIDSHLQKEYEMVIDSFSDANIIIYTTKRERDISAARQLDTLFKSYNDINTHKLNYTFLNINDSTLPAARRSLSYYMQPGERNVVLMTCYEEAFVNSQLRTIKEGTIVFGMPTWIDAEQIRADYLNKAAPYYTDNFYADTTLSSVNSFISEYNAEYNQKPSRYSYLGYDAMRYLSVIFAKYGKAFTQGFDNDSYDGLGYSFHISPVIRISKATGDPVVNYYTNTAMHIFQLSDYKVWRVN
jgi:ABC-type branched-subunit amino acid transport system substrate-binding protein